MIELIKNIFPKPTPRELGIRGTNSGKLYVDKSVFYKRAEVKNIIDRVEGSKIIQKQLQHK